MIQFTVPGNPLPKQSFRYSKKGSYTDPKTKAWHDTVAWKAKEAMFGKEWLKGDISVEIKFVRGNNRRVDLDNLSKNVLDACNGIVWKDDVQIVELVLTKEYDKDAPRVEFWAGELI